MDSLHSRGFIFVGENHIHDEERESDGEGGG
jgi:hypothetical protein